MSENEKLNLIKKIQTNSDKKSLELLFNAHKNLIWKIALRYTPHKTIEIDDVVQEGYIGFIESIQLFNSNLRTIKEEAEFHHFTSVVVRNKILKFIYKQNSIGKNRDFSINLETIHSFPEINNGLKHYIFSHINKNLNSLESLIIKWKFGLDNGTYYTTEEISKITSFSTRRINQIIEISLNKLKNSIEKESKFNNKNLFLGE